MAGPVAGSDRVDFYDAGDNPGKSKSTLRIRFEINSMGIDGMKCNQKIPFGKNEKYALTAERKEIHISCCAEFGCMHGIRSLSQLIFDSTCLGKACRCLPRFLNITDEPEVRYRGILIDTGRAFFSVDFLKKLFDGVALLKMNAIHWHLNR